ncbi:hypothetical protein [Rhodopirellula bahusiensis]|uniref:hypothetical protein n=1 Tax=Rhodopirellula bahusiensis TaxID=2014065 RepID=UPI00326578EE
MTHPTETVRRTIQEQLKPIQEREEKLELELETTRVVRRQLTDALKALDASDKRTDKRNRSSKPCCTKDVVATACQGVLENHAVTRDQLESWLKKHLKAKGYSLAGFRLRFSEVLQSDFVTVSSDGLVRRKVVNEPVDNQSRGATEPLKPVNDSVQS